MLTTASQPQHVIKVFNPIVLLTLKEVKESYKIYDQILKAIEQKKFYGKSKKFRFYLMFAMTMTRLFRIGLL